MREAQIIPQRQASRRTPRHRLSSHLHYGMFCALPGLGAGWRAELVLDLT